MRRKKKKKRSRYLSGTAASILSLESARIHFIANRYFLVLAGKGCRRVEIEIKGASCRAPSKRLSAVPGNRAHLYIHCTAAALDIPISSSDKTVYTGEEIENRARARVLLPADTSNFDLSSLSARYTAVCRRLRRRTVKDNRSCSCVFLDLASARCGFLNAARDLLVYTARRTLM